MRSCINATFLQQDHSQHILKIFILQSFSCARERRKFWRRKACASPGRSYSYYTAHYNLQGHPAEAIAPAGKRSTASERHSDTYQLLIRLISAVELNLCFHVLSCSKHAPSLPLSGTCTVIAFVPRAPLL